MVGLESAWKSGSAGTELTAELVSTQKKTEK